MSDSSTSLSDSKAERLANAVNEVENKRLRVVQCVDDIREFRRQQKPLYRKYYRAMEDLGDTIEKYKNEPIIHGCVKHFREVNADDIFGRGYKSKRMVSKDEILKE